MIGITHVSNLITGYFLLPWINYLKLFMKKYDVVIFSPEDYVANGINIKDNAPNNEKQPVNTTLNVPWIYAG